MANLKMKNVRETKRGNNISFKQIYKDLPLEDKVVAVNLNKQGQIKFVKSNYYPHADIDIGPKITAEDAAAIVKDDLGVEKLLQVIKKVTAWSSKDEISTPVPELVIIPGQEKGKAQLAWKFHFNQKDTSHCWYYGIDAHTGEIIVKRDTTRNFYTYGNDVDGDVYLEDGDDLSSRNLENLMVDIYCYDTDYYYWNFTNNYGDYGISYPSGYWYHRICAGTFGNKCAVINDDTDNPAFKCRGWWYGEIPSQQNFHFDYTPGDSYSDFDCVNAYYHITESLEEYYDDNWNFDLGYEIYVYTHYELDDDYAGYNTIPNPFIMLGHGDDLNNAAHARDVMLHEVQHAVTDYIWVTAFETINTNFELALNEAYSDYHACSQVGDWVMGDWYCNGEPNCERDLTNHMADPNWDSTPPYDKYNNSLVISHAFYEIQYAIGLSNADDCIFASNEDVRPNDFEDLYDALCDECSDPNTVRNILDTHWGGLL